MNTDPIVVVGDGWAALAAVGFLASSGVEVRWIEGSGTKMTAPLASMASTVGMESKEGLESDRALDICSELGRQLGVSLGEHQQGSFIREYRNKSFRQPPWMKAPEPVARLEVRNQTLWAPETRIASVLSARYSIPLLEVEERFREALLNQRFRNLQRITGVPMSSLQPEVREDGEGRDPNCDEITLVVGLANGQFIRCRQVIYADRWSLLRKLAGFPKSMKFIQKRDPVGALQAVFEHKSPVGLGVSESFYAPLHKENGEEIERNLWGYFSSDGMRSFWTLCLAEDEVENNHEIAKKFRRLKSTLDRIFTGDVFVPRVLPQVLQAPEKPENTAKFTANILREQVRLVEDALYAAGDVVTEPVVIPQLPGVLFLTDGYGPAAALQQVGAMLGIGVLEDRVIFAAQGLFLDSTV